MSFSIDINRIDGVLLADGWYEVLDRSFDISEYEYVCFGQSVYESGTDSLGYTFETMRNGKRVQLTGPYTEILSVQYELVEDAEVKAEEQLVSA